MQRLLGVKNLKRGAVADGHVLLKREVFGEPTGIDAPWDRVELSGAEELYPLYLSWDPLNPECRNMPNNWPMHGQVDEEKPDPARIPAAVTRRLGDGRIVHLCTEVFAQYARLGDPQILRWLREVLELLEPQPFCSTEAPSWVDLTLRRSSTGDLLAHFVNQNPGRDVAKLGSDDIWVDEIPEVGPFRLSVRLSKKPRALTWEPGAVKLTGTYADSVLSIEVPRFRIHGCVAMRI